MTENVVGLPALAARSKIDRPLQRRFGRDRVLRRLAGDEANVFLLTRQRTRERQPRANCFTGRHGIGLDGKRLRDANAPRRGAGLVAREHRIANLAVMRDAAFRAGRR